MSGLAPSFLPCALCFCVPAAHTGSRGREEGCVEEHEGQAVRRPPPPHCSASQAEKIRTHGLEFGDQRTTGSSQGPPGSCRGWPGAKAGVTPSRTETWSSLFKTGSGAIQASSSGVFGAILGSGACYLSCHSLPSRSQTPVALQILCGPPAPQESAKSEAGGRHAGRAGGQRPPTLCSLSA